MTTKELQQLKTGRALRLSCKHTQATWRAYVKLLHKQLEESKLPLKDTYEQR